MINIVINIVFKIILNQGTMRNKLKKKSLYDSDLIKFDSIAREISCMSKIDALNSEVGSRNSEARSQKSEAGSGKPEAGSHKPEAGSRKQEIGYSEVAPRLSYF